jgi:hydroxymethylpyrimidine/phosphomethylpyrimidine kinase
MAAITLITVQNSVSVSRVEVLGGDLVSQQIAAVISDIPPTAAKTGALGSSEVVKAVAAMAAEFKFPLIVDPVMISKHGARLISPEAEGALKSELLPHAFLATPNIPEAELLSGLAIHDEEDMLQAARRLCGLGCRAVLIKGGHLAGPPVDVLFDGDSVKRFEGTRVRSRHTHGTGCTLSAAITANVALGFGLYDAVGRAKRFVQAAIETAPAIGHGHGPLNHWV